MAAGEPWLSRNSIGIGVTLTPGLRALHGVTMYTMPSDTRVRTVHSPPTMPDLSGIALGLIRFLRHGALILLAFLLVTACGRETPTNVSADSPASAGTQAASRSESNRLAISCGLDDARQRVTCEASGYVEGARLYWWTNADDVTNSKNAPNGGATFTFTITRARPDLTVSFEECTSGACQSVTATLATAHLMPPKPATTISPEAKPSPFRAGAAHPVATRPVTAGLGDMECITDSDPQLVFTHEVVPLELIRHTAPPGSVFSGMLKGHMYFFVGPGIPVQKWSGYPRSVPIYAPVDSWLRSVQVYKTYVAGEEVLEYEFLLEASCEVWYRLGHLAPLSERIQASGPFKVGLNWVDPPLHVDGGELLSYWSGVNPGGHMDLGVFNTTVKQTLANPDRHSDGRHDQQLYEDCPLDYFSDDLRSQYYSMLAEENTAEPVKTETCRRSADQDVAGTISGRWYIPDRYATVMAVGTSLLGSARISFAEAVLPGGASSLSVGPDQPTYIHPAQVTSEHCYQSRKSNTYVNLKLVTPTDLEAEYGSGTCASRTPTNTLRAER